MMDLQAPSAPTGPQIPEIRDIAAPVDVFPWPLWMVLVAGFVILLVFMMSGLLSRLLQPIQTWTIGILLALMS